MNEEINVRNHINKFNKCVTLLLSLEVKIDEEDQTIFFIGITTKII